MPCDQLWLCVVHRVFSRWRPGRQWRSTWRRAHLERRDGGRGAYVWESVSCFSVVWSGIPWKIGLGGGLVGAYFADAQTQGALQPTTVFSSVTRAVTAGCRAGAHTGPHWEGRLHMRAARKEEVPGGGALVAVFHCRFLWGRKEDRESPTPPCLLPRSLLQLSSGQCAIMKRRADRVPLELGPSRFTELTT